MLRLKQKLLLGAVLMTDLDLAGVVYVNVSHVLNLALLSKSTRIFWNILTTRSSSTAHVLHHEIFPMLSILRLAFAMVQDQFSSFQYAASPR